MGIIRRRRSATPPHVNVHVILNVVKHVDFIHVMAFVPAGSEKGSDFTEEFDFGGDYTGYSQYKPIVAVI